MANRSKARPDFTALPMLPRESIYIGIDVGKFKHVAGFVSKTLLERHKHFESCPAFIFEQSREGFRALVERIRTYCPLEQCFILLEQTGHYHRPLLQYLLELDVSVYVMHVQSRQGGMLKTDKRDALSLANHLYNQLALGAQLENKLQVVRRAVPPSEAAAQLKGLMRHRYELVNEATQRKNITHRHLRRDLPGINPDIQKSEPANRIRPARKVSHSTRRGNGKPDGTSRGEEKEFSL